MTFVQTAIYGVEQPPLPFFTISTLTTSMRYKIELEYQYCIGIAVRQIYNLSRYIIERITARRCPTYRNWSARILDWTCIPVYAYLQIAYIYIGGRFHLSRLTNTICGRNERHCGWAFGG